MYQFNTISDIMLMTNLELEKAIVANLCMYEHGHQLQLTHLQFEEEFGVIEDVEAVKKGLISITYENKGTYEYVKNGQKIEIRRKEVN